MLSDSNTDYVKVGHAKPPPEEKLSNLDKYLYSRGRYAIMERDDPLPGRYFTSNNFFISRDNMEKLEGFDTAFTGWGGEDIDFGLRLEKAGIKIKNAADAITYHYHKRTIRSLVDDYIDFGKNSFEYLINKHPEFLEQIPANILGISRPRNVRDFLLKALSPITVNAGSMKLAEAVAKSLQGMGCPDFLYDYLFWGSMALGYKKRARQNEG
jgi:GT2 family glycosyltransferase